MSAHDGTDRVPEIHSTPEVHPRPRIAVVFGGRSAEHAVSCVSAGSVLAAIDRSTYEVVPVGITMSGRWVLAPDDPAQLSIRDGVLPSVPESGSAVVLAADPTSEGLVIHEPGAVPRALGEVDVVFPLLHGPFGEDGTIQGLLEMAGVPYIGSGVFASAAAMDKGHMKAMFVAAGLPVGAYEVISPRDWERDAAAEVGRLRGRLKLPLFVKPCRAGSSVGISKVTTWADLPAAVETARRHDPRVIIEAMIVGREIECGVLQGLEGGSPEASVVAEVIVHPDHEFYDFAAKYLGGSDLVVPADVDADVSQRLQELAVRAFESLSCEGLARVDFFLLSDGSVLVNEVNTMPGFTPVSMFPLMWAASGLDYPALVDRLVRTAMARPRGLR